MVTRQLRRLRSLLRPHINLPSFSRRSQRPLRAKVFRLEDTGETLAVAFGEVAAFADGVTRGDRRGGGSSGRGVGGLPGSNGGGEGSVDGGDEVFGAGHLVNARDSTLEGEAFFFACR